MKYRILRDNKFLGDLVFSGLLHHFSGDDATRVLIADQVRSGVSYFHDEPTGDAMAVVQTDVMPADRMFPFALIQTLRHRGFDVEAIDPSVESEFERVTTRVARTGSGAPVEQLRTRWNEMSLLEKSYLLDLLERDGITSAP